MNKQFFVTILIFAIAASTANAACAERKEGDSDFIEDAKCTLTKAKDTVSDGFSDFVANEKVQSAVGYISNKTAVASDVVKDAATKTGGFLSNAWSKFTEKSKTGYAAVKDFVQGKKDSEAIDGEGVIGVRGLDESTPRT
jgi:hypothetical protein